MQLSKNFEKAQLESVLPENFWTRNLVWISPLLTNWATANKNNWKLKSQWLREGVKIPKDQEPVGLIFKGYGMWELEYVGFPWEHCLAKSNTHSFWDENSALKLFCHPDLVGNFSQKVLLEKTEEKKTEISVRKSGDKSPVTITSLNKETHRGEGEGFHNDGKHQKKTTEVIEDSGAYDLNNLTETSKKTCEIINGRPSPNWSPRDFDFHSIPDPEIRDVLLRLSNLIYLRSQDYPSGLETFIYLRKAYLRENYGKRRIEEALKIGFDSGLIEPDGFYVVGEKSIGYRFGEAFRTGQFKIRNVFLKPKELKKLQELLRRNPHLRYLHTHLQTVTIDQRLLSEVDPNSEIWELLQMINSKIWFFGKDNFSGRIHHNLSNLKKEARALLRINGGGNSLWEVDIANSQPLFAGLAAQSKGFEDSSFLSLCQEGTLYDVLGDIWGLTRDAAKTETFKIFFSKNGHRSESKAIFERLFPTFSEFMTKSKSVKHQHFSELAQREERRTIIDSVLPEFIKKAKGSFISTIHDSLLVREGQVELVKEILNCEFLGKWGIKPKLHLKDTKNYLV